MAKSEWPDEWSVHFPGRKCREAVWNGDIPHSCELAEAHAGSCASPATPASIQRRQMWIKRLSEGQDS